MLFQSVINLPNPKLLILLLTVTGMFLKGCVDIYDQEKYQKPDWLAGKLYTQVAAQENLVQFTECLKILGFDTILDVSGSFTIFGPSDDAMAQYMADNQYSSVSDIPKPELDRIVKYHIIQNSWSKSQLQRLDFDGWIDPANPESEPKAYKRQTLLKNPTEKYWIKKRKTEDIIVLDSTTTNKYKKVYTRSRKYVPIFFDAFFDIYNLFSQDYRFYFDRDYEPGNIYYAEAKVIQSEIFAENGYVYVIDRVVKPKLNAKELLERELPGESYKVFLDLIYQFPKFSSNLIETYDQTAARGGGTFDTLYDLSFPRLPFDIHEELTGPNINVSNYTYLYHNGVYVPTDDAFQVFLDEVVTSKSGYPHWPNFESVPLDIKQIIVKSHFTANPVYATDINEGFKDGDGNIIYLDEADIERKEFGSNCTFLGLNKTVVPRAFSSVTGPVYLRPGYSLFMYAMQHSKVLNAITKEGVDYAFFPIPDHVMAEDSSLMMEWIDQELNRYRFKAFSRTAESFVGQPAGVLGKRILNQVGTNRPTGSANKEFLQTLGSNFLIWNNLDATVRGSRPNTFGYQGDSLIFYTPVALEEPADNGVTWRVDSWFNHVKTEMFGALSAYPAFMNLIRQAGLYDETLYTFPFLTEGEFYTIFIPSAQALADYRADTLAQSELESFLKYHFVKGERIFTDNKLHWKNYETLRKDEASTQFSTVFSTLNIRPGPDLIEILDASGESYVTITEAEGVSNVMVATDTDDSSTDDTDFIITSVIHEIDSVLIKQ
jgi:uncharacterized surface protein with fasciclin (FAS1) repeats